MKTWDIQTDCVWTESTTQKDMRKKIVDGLHTKKTTETNQTMFVLKERRWLNGAGTGEDRVREEAHEEGESGALTTAAAQRDAAAALPSREQARTCPREPVRPMTFITIASLMGAS